MRQPMHIRETPAGPIVDHFPDEVIITRELIEGAHRAYLRRTGFRALTFEPLNGRVIYRMVGRGPYPRTFHCLRED